MKSFHRFSKIVLNIFKQCNTFRRERGRNDRTQEERKRREERKKFFYFQPEKLNNTTLRDTG